MPEPHLRAGDDDREAVATALGSHMAAGRLTLAEYEDRLARAYAARTFGELAELTADLPRVPAAAAPAPPPGPMVHVPPPPAPLVLHEHAQHSWRAWLSTSVIVLVVYLVVSLGNRDFDYFWPMWVIGPWGAALLAQRIRGGGARPMGSERG